MKNIDYYKRKVLRYFPKSKCERDGVLFFVSCNKKDLGAGFSIRAAWQSAYITIKKYSYEKTNMGRCS